MHAYKTIPIGQLSAAKLNPRTHSPAQIEKLRRSIREFGFTNPLLVDEKAQLIAGHGRLAAAQAEGMLELPAIEVAGLSAAQKRALLIADNQLAADAGWDEAALAEMIADLKSEDFDLSLTGFDADDLEAILAGAEPHRSHTFLAQRFLIPPFSVFNAREGWWQERKAAWLKLGIQSDAGRGENLLEFSDAVNGGGYGPKKRKKPKVFSTEGNASKSTGTSIFDPVLCEIAYRWFAPIGGLVLDPFAGGSVRGIVAGILGRKYLGIDLAAGQVKANVEQAAAIFAAARKDAKKSQYCLPEWRQGNSLVLNKIAKNAKADFLFSCPPYGDLERYSDNPADLSTMDWEGFLGSYRAIIAQACARLQPDRFACFVVGDYRDKQSGAYRNLVSETIRAFIDAGLQLYNEAILVTAVGSLSIRVGRQFSASRKLGKTHQNILVFIKGDAAKATEACGPVDVAVPDAMALDPAAGFGHVLQ
jgi:hypothetical protein